MPLATVEFLHLWYIAIKPVITLKAKEELYQRNNSRHINFIKSSSGLELLIKTHNQYEVGVQLFGDR